MLINYLKFLFLNYYQEYIRKLKIIINEEKKYYCFYKCFMLHYFNVKTRFVFYL